MPRLTNRFDHFTTTDRPRPVSCDIDIPMTDSVDSIDITVEQNDGPAKFLQMRRIDRATNTWVFVSNLQLGHTGIFPDVANTGKPKPPGSGLQKMGDKLKAALPQGVTVADGEKSGK